MNTYQISYYARRGETIQSIDLQVRAQRYTTDGDTLTLFNTSISGEIEPVASFKNWNFIIDMNGMPE